tara:strand:+ start:2789 stop:2923 length:135 start_codon:yes stop_codon:yes gene_type:complete
VNTKSKISFAAKYFLMTFIKWATISIILTGITLVPFYIFTILLK